MLGAIYGDKAGSIYEFGQLKKIKPVSPAELVTTDSFFSDDTIETIAVIDAIINNKDYGETLRKYVLMYENYKPNFHPYFKSAFSPNTINWAKRNGRCDSIGNGAMMRISPIGYLFNNENDVIKNSKLVTITSHNSDEAIYSATIISLMIFYFRDGMSKDYVYKKLKLPINYEPFLKFNTTCSETLQNCLYVIYNSKSFDDSIRKTLLMGGDTDTNACIVGSVAESLYGMNEEQKKLSMLNLPNDFIKVLKRVYK